MGMAQAALRGGQQVDDESYLDGLRDKITSREWRMRSLYKVRDDAAELVTFKPYETQRYLIDNLKRKNNVLKGRQMRVTTGYCALWLDAALWNKSGLQIGIIAHTKGDASKIFKNKICLPYDQLPDELKTGATAVVKRTESEIGFANGSNISVGVSFRSGNLQILHVTEYGYICARQPLRAEEIRTGAFIAAQRGIIVIESTAMGQAGHFHELCQQSQRGPDHSEWSFHFLPWYMEPTYSSAVTGNFAEQREKETDYLDKLQATAGIRFTPGQRRWWCIQRREFGDLVYREFPSCIAGDVLVATSRGLVKMRDVEPDGEYILAKFEKGERQTYRVITGDGYEVVCTDDHPILCPDGVFRKLREINVGDSVVLGTGGFSEQQQIVTYDVAPFVKGSIEISQDFAEFIGLFMGDGSFHRNVVSIACDAQDLDTVKRAEDFMRRFLGGATSRIIGDKQGCLELRISNVKFEAPFNALELLRKNASQNWKRKVHVPTYIFSSPRNIAAAFLRGLFEADGFVTRDGNAVKFFTKYDDFRKQIQTLLLMFGIKSRSIKKIKQSGSGGEYIGYEISLRAAGVRVFRKEIGFISSRKNNRLSIISDVPHFNEKSAELSDVIASIELDLIQPVFDITTSTAQFVAGGIVVHNCPEEAFKASTEGAYYGPQMLDCWRKGRVTDIPIDPYLPCETWWDIGYGDSTSIWFVQRQGMTTRIIDFYENSGEGVEHYANFIRDWMKTNNVRSMRCVGPHDLSQGRWSTGKTQLQSAADHGLMFDVVDRTSVADGIEAVRRALPFCLFDESRCAEGIKKMERYRKRWNEGLGVWSNEPLHDDASHAADAFRTGVMGIQMTPIIAGTGSTPRTPARPIEAVRWR